MNRLKIYKRNLKQFFYQRKQICKFFGIDSAKRTLSDEEFINALRKLGLKEATVQLAYNQWKNEKHVIKYQVYLSHKIIGVWPEVIE